MSQSATWRSPHGRPLPSIGGRTLLMAVLNVTPDSFSDGGRLRNLDDVVAHAAAMRQDGADVLDIGGESTRPGAEPVSEAEELARVLPAIRALRERFPDAPISIDTFKPRVAEAAVEAGADIVNDVWGGLAGVDAHTRAKAVLSLGGGENVPAAVGRILRSEMAETVARLGSPVILMHNRPDREYRDFWFDLQADLRLSVTLAMNAGVPHEQIWLDPGFGFAKSPAQNLEVLKHLGRIVSLGHPVLLGTSRKSTIGKVLGSEVDDRVDGTGATIVWGIAQGCAMVRVHDVAAMKRYARMADAIRLGADWAG